MSYKDTKSNFPLLIIYIFCRFVFLNKKELREQDFIKLLLITLVLLGLGVAGIAIKIWAKKDGKFAGTCASQNPMLNKDGDACGFCGKTPEQYEDCAEPTHT